MKTRASVATVRAIPGSFDIPPQAGAGSEWEALRKKVSAAYSASKYDRAAELALTALELAVKQTSAVHPGAVASMTDLAAVFMAQGNHTDAERLYKRALAILDKALPRGNELIVIGSMNLARCFLARGKHAQAEVHLQRVLPILEKKLGPNDLVVADTLEDLAAASFGQRKHAQAAPLLRRALAIREKALGSSHPEVTVARRYLAVLCPQTGGAGKPKHSARGDAQRARVKR